MLLTGSHLLYILFMHINIVYAQKFTYCRHWSAAEETTILALQTWNDPIFKICHVKTWSRRLHLNCGACVPDYNCAFFPWNYRINKSTESRCLTVWSIHCGFIQVQQLIASLPRCFSFNFNQKPDLKIQTAARKPERIKQTSVKGFRHSFDNNW